MRASTMIPIATAAMSTTTTLARRRRSTVGTLGAAPNSVRDRRGAPVASPIVSRTASFKAPVGTRDVLPPESARWEELIARFAQLAEAAGYGLLQSPLFEDFGVFQRLGEGTDVVRKEMYDFDDKGGRHIALRPEGTASVARAFAEHRPQVVPWKVWYATACFRSERPQAGRLRQHHQVGIEALGSADPDLDVEVITVGRDFLRALGLERVTLLVNSMGTSHDRSRYVEVLRDWLAARRDELDPEDRDKIDSNPMRVLDSKRAATKAAVVDAPSITEYLSAGAEKHFERVRAGLAALGVDIALEPRLVRGLDYYTHTTFEFVSNSLDAAQSTLLGGGRYDGLVEDLGGPPTPGIGFGSGIERVLLACDAEGVFASPGLALDVFVVDVAGGDSARDLTAELRRAGLSADRSFDGRTMRAQMKAADRSGASLALIIGGTELAEGVVSVRPLREEFGAAQESIPRDHVVAHVAKLLQSGR
jgi:histidyl-tRNA synthetase